jgi:ABC-type glycerol-3-phosphate transport system permease component
MDRQFIGTYAERGAIVSLDDCVESAGIAMDDFRPPVGLGGEAQWEIVMAASVIATVPMIIVFFLGQRYFVQGAATTGRKG